MTWPIENITPNGRTGCSYPVKMTTGSTKMGLDTFAQIYIGGLKISFDSCLPRQTCFAPEISWFSFWNKWYFQVHGCFPHQRKGLFPKATDQCLRCPTVLCWNFAATWSARGKRSKRHLHKWQSNNQWSCRTHRQTSPESLWVGGGKRSTSTLFDMERSARAVGKIESLVLVWSWYLVFVQASLVIHLKRAPAPFRTGLDFFPVTNTWPLFCLSGMNVIKFSPFGKHLL